MTSRFDATKKKKIITWRQLLFFAALLIGFSLILFPKKLLMQSIMRDQTPNQVSISYLKNWIKIDPNNNPLKVSLAEQEVTLGQIKEAKTLLEPYITLSPHTEIQWKILWIYYEITRIEAFALKENDPQRTIKVKSLLVLLPRLINSPKLTGKQAALMAEDALAFNCVNEASALYKIAANDKSLNKSSQFFAAAARTMLYVKDYQASADFYLMAMHQSTAFVDKRMYYIKAVNSLEASGVTSTALTFAEKNIDGLSSDKNTLIYLTNLALKANKPKETEQYIGRILKLKYRE